MANAWVGIDLSTNVPALHGVEDAGTQRAVLGSSHLRPSRLSRACQFEADREDAWPQLGESICLLQADGPAHFKKTGDKQKYPGHTILRSAIQTPHPIDSIVVHKTAEFQRTQGTDRVSPASGCGMPPSP